MAAYVQGIDIAELLDEIELLRDREAGYLEVQRSHRRTIADLEARVKELERGREPLPVCSPGQPGL